jgi:glycosyltransferase involved in cell wall biosynthesis
MPKLLIIGHTFPETASTAAGQRMLQLIAFFAGEGFEITFATSAARTSLSDPVETLGVTTKAIRLNSDSFDHFIKDLSPDVVLFDRFMTEEQFGWRVAQNCPEAARILDSEDLHFLRRARELSFDKDEEAFERALYSELALREIASIYRCDLSLIISEAEITLLTDRFKVPGGLLYYLPLFPQERPKYIPDFDQREGFVTIGNFRHRPNLDAVKWLHREIWPAIRKRLPNATLSIYGAYIPQQISDLHSPNSGFLVKGWAPQVSQVMLQARVALTPLRFGAGLKGKIIDAFNCGTPVVTTPIGAEGIGGALSFPVKPYDESGLLVEQAVNLYLNKAVWQQARDKGFELLERRFNRDAHLAGFANELKVLKAQLGSRRRENFIGQMLRQQSLYASKYLSKWIALKNRR